MTKAEGDIYVVHRISATNAFSSLMAPVLILYYPIPRL